jgi:hypothetical protein
MPRAGRKIAADAISPELAHLVGAQQAAAILGVTPLHVRKLKLAGLLPAVTSAIGALYPRTEVEALAWRRLRQRQQTRSKS